MTIDFCWESGWIARIRRAGHLLSRGDLRSGYLQIRQCWPVGFGTECRWFVTSATRCDRNHVGSWAGSSHASLKQEMVCASGDKPVISTTLLQTDDGTRRQFWPRIESWWPEGPEWRNQSDTKRFRPQTIGQFVFRDEWRWLQRVPGSVRNLTFSRLGRSAFWSNIFIPLIQVLIAVTLGLWSALLTAIFQQILECCKMQ